MSCSPHPPLPIAIILLFFLYQSNETGDSNERGTEIRVESLSHCECISHQYSCCAPLTNTMDVFISTCILSNRDIHNHDQLR